MQWQDGKSLELPPGEDTLFRTESTVPSPEAVSAGVAPVVGRALSGGAAAHERAVLSYADASAQMRSKISRGGFFQGAEGVKQPLMMWKSFVTL